MNSKQLTVTVYQKTTKQLPVSITDCKETFKGMNIFKINLQKSRETRIETFLEKDTRWLEFVLYRDNYIESQINLVFNNFNQWMREWIEAEAKSAGNNYHLLANGDELLNICQIHLLAVMMMRKDIDFKNFLEYARYVFQAYLDRSFEFQVFVGKRDYFQQYCWPSGQVEMEFERFIEELNLHLFIFINIDIENSDKKNKTTINDIFVAEIRHKLGIRNVPLAQLEEIFSSIVGSFDTFRRFINRNYLYWMIETGLENEGVIYNQLSSNQNHAKEYEIIISSANFKEYVGKSYRVHYSGIKSSPRYIGDHLITFGKQSAEEFTNDISLPNMNDVDSIFAVIFINHNGLNLMDISKKSTVKIKVAPGTCKLVSNDMVIVLAKSHQFVIHISQGVGFSGSGLTLKLSAFDDCKTTKTINSVAFVSGQNFTIGSGPECTFRIQANDISPVHAVIFMHTDENFYIYDNNSENGTFYRLKTKTQIEKELPSAFHTLSIDEVFQVKFFNFLVKDPNATGNT